MGTGELAEQEPNPYQPPADDPSVEAIRGAIDDALSLSDRAEFCGEVTTRDLRQALRLKGFRADLAQLRRSRWVLLAPAVVLGLLHWMAYRQTGIWSDKTAVLIVCMLAYFVYVVLLGYWIIHQSVQLNMDSVGPTSGWIDRDRLYVADDDGQGFVSIDSLVGFAMSRRQLVLSSDKTHSRFITLPFRIFDDPDTAQILAKNLTMAKPFSKPEAFDPRRMELPTVGSDFQPSDQAIFYSGALLRADIEGTPLEKRVSLVKWVAFCRTVMTLGIPMVMVSVLGLPTEFIWVAAVFLALVLLRVTYRILRAPIIGQADAEVMFRTAGWIEDSGLVAISATGEGSLKWSAFGGKATITDRLIAIQTKSQSVWQMIGRGQFESEDDWLAACEIVRKHLAVG